MRRYQLIPSHAVQTLLITTTSPITSGEVTLPYSFSFNAIGGTPPYTWSETGTLPTGFTLSSGGTLSGTPSATYANSFNVTVSDSIGSHYTASFNLTIVAAVSITTTSPLPNATESSSYSFTMAATGGFTPYTWSLLSSTGSNSWSVSPTGVVTGLPGSVEIDTLDIQVVDALGVPSAANFNLTVNSSSGTTFNFFMSPTGDDTLGNGSLGNPWSITAINAKASTYSGMKVGIIGDIGATLSGFQWTGTSGQFSCNASTITVGMYLMITGTAGGSGSLTGYASGNVYYVSATNGSTSGTLTTKGGSQAQALITTAGTPTGLTLLLNQPILYGTSGGAKTTIISLVNAAGNNPALQVNGGTVASQTYIASCNSTGVYTPRWAVIDATDGAGNFSTNLNGIIMGQSSQSTTIFPAQSGYTTYDALTIRGIPFCAIIMDYQANPQQQNITIQNCEFYNGVCGSSSSNPGVIRYRNVNGIVIHNNKFYDHKTTAGPGSPNWGLSAIMAYGQNTSTTDASVITNNTVYNSSSCLQKDQSTDFANCSYNYFDHGNFGSAGTSDTGIAQGSICGQQPAAGVTTNIHHNIFLGCMYFYPQSTTNNALGTYNIYNNTFYGSPSTNAFVVAEISTGNGASPPTPPNGTCSVQFNNNLTWAANGWGDFGNGSGPFFIIGPAQFSVANATFNNNVYGSGQTFSRTYSSKGSFAAWQTATGADQTSVQISSTPFISPPISAVPSSFATNSNAVIGATTCGALDGSGPVGCNFSNVQ